MSKTDDLLNDAMARTDADIMADALGNEEPGDDADRSLEEMGDGPEGNGEITAEAEGEEGEPAEGEEETGEAEGDEPAADPEEPAEVKGLPPAARTALLAERKTRQAAESALEALRTESKAQLDAMNARLDRALSAIEPRQRTEAPAAPETPDPVLDPDGYRQSVLSEADQRYTLRRVADTFAEAHETHGKVFEDANAALNALDRANPGDRATVQRIASAANPGKALITWHRQQVALREIGTDPEAYKARIREQLLADPEVVKAAVAKARGEAETGGPEGRPRSVTRLPPSLNRARGGARAETISAADNTDQAIFDHAMTG